MPDFEGLAIFAEGDGISLLRWGNSGAEALQSLKAIGRIEARLGAGLINRTPRLALTMHAPHKPAPHPSFVPVSLSCSRMAHRSEVSAGAPELTAWPLMRNSVPFAPPRTE